MKTPQQELLALLKKRPSQFVEAFAIAASEMEAAKWNEEKPELQLTAEGLREDYGSNPIAYLAYESIGFPVHGIVLREEYAKGGGEGGGEDVVRVWSVTVDNYETPLTYLRATGYYQSYNGTEWNDDIEVVEPREVIETRFFNKVEMKRFLKEQQRSATGTRRG